MMRQKRVVGNSQYLDVDLGERVEAVGSDSSWEIADNDSTRDFDERVGEADGLEEPGRLHSSWLLPSRSLFLAM
jgi:hypothetical protein